MPVIKYIMDTIFYLAIKKEKTAGGLKNSPPVFVIRQQESCCHIVYVDIPEDYKPVEYPMQIPPPPPWAIELLQYMQPYVWKNPMSYVICDPSVDKWLKKEGYWGWWQQCFPLPEFQDYYRREFLDCLLEQAEETYRQSLLGQLADYLVLGYDVSVLQMLWYRGKYIRSLRFLLPYIPEELEEWMEDFYEEYGITAALQEGYQKIVCKSPSVILDFSGKTSLATVGVAPGSVWIDMDSQEEKRRRIEGRDTGIHYFSMKKHWKGIDTLYKNRYNT